MYGRRMCPIKKVSNFCVQNVDDLKVIGNFDKLSSRLISDRQ